MATDWNDPEINPLGLLHIEPTSSRPMRAIVPVEVRVLAYFSTKDDFTYLCAFVDEARRREVYMETPDGFVKVLDPTIQYTIARMTDEIIEKRRS